MEKIREDLWNNLIFIFVLTFSFYTIVYSIRFVEDMTASLMLFFSGVVCALTIICIFGQEWEVKGFKKKC